MTFWVTVNASIIVNDVLGYSQRVNNCRCVYTFFLHNSLITKWKRPVKKEISSIAKTQMLHNDEFIFTGKTMCESCVGFYLCEYCKRFYLQSILFMQFWIRIWSFLFKNCVSIIFVIISEYFYQYILSRSAKKLESDRFRNTGPKNS